MKKLTLIFLCCCSVILCADSNIVCAWNFDNFENNTVKPAAGNLSARAIRPRQIKVVPGKQGNALTFHGPYRGNKAGALVVKNFKFDFTQPFTIEAIVMFDDKVKRTLCREIFNIADSERGPGVRLNFYYNTLALRSGNGKTAVTAGTDNTKTNVSANEWHLITVTYDGKTTSVYLDGVVAARKEIPIATAKTHILTIGSYKSGYSYPLQGAVDDLKFYKGCKTAAEVAEKYISVFGE